MEKKKLLLVAVSVGIFLVIVISAAILIFTPKAPETGTAVSAARPIPAGVSGTLPQQTPIQQMIPERTQPATVDAADMVRKTDEIQGIQSPPQATAVQENHFYINGETPNDAYVVEKNDGSAATRVVINVPKPSTAAVPDTPAASSGRSAPRQTAPVNRPAAAVVPARTSAPAAAKPAAVKPAAAPQTRTYNDYWVQTGAFSAKVRAEGVKETLSSKGITSIIENREVDGKTWYRVRVGPYTSENEANYWLALVKSIDGFAGSQIRQTRSQR
ncbi:MAG: SPOR domain-containing protein [Treponema sp.]|jgi:DedD protein|nr:SPOR domain-containing protein [Treponema sp.]